MESSRLTVTGRWRIMHIMSGKDRTGMVGHTDSSENLLDNPILIVLGVDLVSILLQTFSFFQALFGQQVPPQAAPDCMLF